MHVLLYRSRARTALLAADLNQIIETARRRNRRLGVTGLLLHGQMETIPGIAGEFVQWIEGPKASVDELFADIAQDSRHTDVEVLARGPREAVEAGVGPPLRPGASADRLFSAWSMGMVRLSELPATLDGFLRFAHAWDDHRIAAEA